MKVHRIIDAAMIILLPLLMAYSLIGETFHEAAGVIMFALFIAHHVLNRGWWKTLFRSKYGAERIFRALVNVLLLLVMILQPLSGILMSRHLFAFLPATGFASLSRQVHFLLAYWGFVLLSFHAGTHFSAMAAPLKRKSQSAYRILCGALTVGAVYGVVAFVKRELPGYLFGQIAFAFFDYAESVVFFLLDYLAVMLLCGCVGYGAVFLLKKLERRKNY